MAKTIDAVKRAATVLIALGISAGAAGAVAPTAGAWPDNNWCPPPRQPNWGEVWHYGPPNNTCGRWVPVQQQDWVWNWDWNYNDYVLVPPW